MTTVADHHVQREILNRLAFAEELRFSELKPDGMESNIFMYHVRQLSGQKLVEKTDRGYRLSPTGMTYVDSISFTSNRQSRQPKLISIIALQNDRGQWLMCRRKVQPYLGSLMFISGKQNFGESSDEHVSRELAEKIGCPAACDLRGWIDIRITDPDQYMVLTHAVGPVYLGSIGQDYMPPASPRFDYVWHDFQDDDDRLMPGTREVYAHLEGHDGQPFFLQMRVSQDA